MTFHWKVCSGKSVRAKSVHHFQDQQIEIQKLQISILQRPPTLRGKLSAPNLPGHLFELVAIIEEFHNDPLRRGTAPALPVKTTLGFWPKVFGFFFLKLSDSQNPKFELADHKAEVPAR